MLKGTLIKSINRYCKENPSWQEEKEVLYLKNFLETDDIKLRHESSDIFFAEFKGYLYSKGENDLSDSIDTDEYLAKTNGELFNKFIEAENIATDHSELDLLPEEIVLHITANYLDTKNIITLSETSSTFYAKTKSIDYWNDKLISAGCNANLIDQAHRTNAITNYQTLYHAFIKMSFLDRVRTKELWEILCLSGQPSAIKYAIDHEGLNANTINHRGENALHLAARSGSVSAIKYTIATLDIDPKSLNNNGRNTFFLNPRRLHDTDQNWLCKMPVEQPRGENILHLSALSGNETAMEYVTIVLGIDPKSENMNGENALHFAARSGSISALEYTRITFGIDPKSENMEGTTCIHFAALSGNYAVFNHALQNLGLDPQSINKNGQNVLHFAALSGNVTMMKHICSLDLVIARLIPQHRNIDIYGNNPLHFAARSGSVANMEYAVKELGIEPNTENIYGNNALNFAALNGDILSMEYARTHLKINPQKTDNMNWSSDCAWLMTATSGHVAAMEYTLKNFQLDPNHNNNRHCNALHFAALSGNINAVIYVLQLDNFIWRPTTENQYGCDAFYYADQNGNYDQLRKALDGNYTEAKDPKSQENSRSFAASF